MQLPIVTETKEIDHAPSDRSSNHVLQRVVGGLELSIKFAHHDDRERVLHAGRSAGWVPAMAEDEWENMSEFPCE